MRKHSKKASGDLMANAVATSFLMSLSLHSLKRVWFPSMLTEEKKSWNYCADCQNVVRTSVTHSAAPRVPLFCSYHILTSSVIYYWTDARQHGIYLLNIHPFSKTLLIQNMYIIYIIMPFLCPYLQYFLAKTTVVSNGHTTGLV